MAVNIHPIQLIAILVAVILIIRTWIKTLKSGSGIASAILWTVLWLAIPLALFLPITSSFIAVNLGIGRGADLIFGSLIVILLILYFGQRLQIEKLQQDQTEVFRGQALLKYNLELIRDEIKKTQTGKKR